MGNDFLPWNEYVALQIKPLKHCRLTFYYSHGLISQPLGFWCILTFMKIDPVTFLVTSVLQDELKNHRFRKTWAVNIEIHIQPFSEIHTTPHLTCFVSTFPPEFRLVCMYTYTLPFKSLGSLRNIFIFQRKALFFQ